MSEEQALVPIEQKTVNFQGDDITAVLVEIEGSEQVYVPVKPICDYLGVDWPSQDFSVCSVTPPCISVLLLFP